MKFTIRTRLTVVYCSVFCASMLALEAGAYFGLSASIDAVVDRELHARLIGVVDFMHDHVAKFQLPRLQAEFRSHGALEPELLAVFDATGTEVFQAPDMRPIARSRRALTSPVIWRTSVRSTQKRVLPLRVLTVRRTVRGRDYDLSLATDLTVPSEVMRLFGWILIVSAPLMLACASIAGYWVSSRALAPVSELIRAAKTIGAANLAQRVIVPTGGDEIQELAVTLNGMLSRIESAFRHVTQFTADASHELRTPLAVMRATAEVALLSPSGNSKSYRDALHRVLREAEKNTGLLDNLLLLARADAIGATANQHPLNLGQKLLQACERVELLAREKNIVLRVDPAGEDEALRRALAISGDADGLLRLCLILLDNAIKYTPEGGVVSASATRTGELVSLEVRDTGIGIPLADQPKIFERFFRTDEARTRGAGAGLGLAIAKWIVESHHATITVEGASGAGSVFRVEFPALAMPRETSSAASPAANHA